MFVEELVQGLLWYLFKVFCGTCSMFVEELVHGLRGTCSSFVEALVQGLLRNLFKGC